jgi:hypothetical protein
VEAPGEALEGIRESMSYEWFEGGKACADDPDVHLDQATMRFSISKLGDRKRANGDGTLYHQEVLMAKRQVASG